MALFTRDQRLADIRKEKARQEKLLANLDAPRVAIAQLAQQEAALLEQDAAEKAELAQLQIELAGFQQEATALAAYVTDIPAMIEGLTKGDRFRTKRGPFAFYTQAAAALRDDKEYYDILLQRIATMTARAKELE